MRAAAVAAVLPALAAPAAVAAAPVGAPDRIGPARPADHRDRPGAVSDWWTLRLVDPRSQGWLEITVMREYREPVVTIAGVSRRQGLVSLLFPVTRLRASSAALDAAGPDSALAVRSGGRRFRLSGPEVHGTLRLRSVRRGPSAHGWRLGVERGPAARRRRAITLNWAMPILTSKVRGALRLADGRRIDLDGWRAGYEHAWGDLLFTDRPPDLWDQVVVHGRGGSGWVAYGLNRRDTITGPGARDAQWLGVLGRTGRDGRLRVCRPAVRRKAWDSTYPDAASWSSQLSFRCPGMRLGVRDRQPDVRDTGTHTEFRSRLRGRVGFSFHRSMNIL